jgi:hypothetical protein
LVPSPSLPPFLLICSSFPLRTLPSPSLLVVLSSPVHRFFLPLSLTPSLPPSRPPSLPPRSILTLTFSYADEALGEEEEEGKKKKKKKKSGGGKLKVGAEGGREGAEAEGGMRTR